MSLTRLERNKIYEAIAASNLDPAECSLAEVPRVGSERFEIRHNSSGSTFTFSTGIIGHGLGYTVKYDVVDGTNVTFDTEYNLDHLTPRIRNWANEVKLIFEAPDRWAELRRSRELITDIQQADSSNTPFTQTEQDQVAAQLQEITEQLKEQFELTSEQIERLEEWRDEVVEASTRMGRKDWFIYVLGTITALIITATVTGGVGEHILAMVLDGLRHLFMGGNEPPRLLA